MLKKHQKTAATIAVLALYAAVASPVFAQITPDVSLRFGNICALIEGILNFILGISGAIALILLAMGGIQYMSSGGDKVAVEQARGRITAALVGLLIVFGAFLVVTTLGNVLIDNFEVCKVANVG